MGRYSLDATPPAKTLTKSRSTHFETQTGNGNVSDGDAVGTGTGGTTASNLTPSAGEDSPSTATNHGANWPAHPSHLGPTPNGPSATTNGNGHHREKSDTLSVTTPGGSSHFGSKYKWTEVLKDLPTAWTPKMGPHSRAMTPSTPGTPSADESFDEKEEMVRKREREKRRKRKKAEIYVSFLFGAVSLHFTVAG